MGEGEGSVSYHTRESMTSLLRATNLVFVAELHVCAGGITSTNDRVLPDWGAYVCSRK